jgi:hypothetical protein
LLLRIRPRCIHGRQIVQFSDYLLETQGRQRTGKGQVEGRQRFVIRSESGRYRTAGRFGFRAGRTREN